MSTTQIFAEWDILGRERRLKVFRRLIKSGEKAKAKEARILFGPEARANVEALQEWLEQRLEDQREMTPEFLAAIERGKADLDAGRHRTVRS